MRLIKAWGSDFLVLITIGQRVEVTGGYPLRRIASTSHIAGPDNAREVETLSRRSVLTGRRVDHFLLAHDDVPLVIVTNDLS